LKTSACATSSGNYNHRRCSQIPPTPHPSKDRRLSIVICSIDNAKFSTVVAMYERLLADVPHEIIRIPDARSMSEGYNRGIDRSSGDVLIVSHDDLENPYRQTPLGLFDAPKSRAVSKLCVMSSRTWPFWPENMESKQAWQAETRKCPGMNTGKHYTPQQIDALRDAKQWPDKAPGSGKR
jgi:hypothetical protein